MTAPPVTSAPVPAPSRPESRVPLTPGRIVALLIGVPVALAAIAFAGFGFVGDVARASYPVHEMVPITGHHVSLNVNGGNMAVSPAGPASEAAGPGSAQLNGTVTYSFDRPRLQVLPAGQAGGTSVALTGCEPVDLGNCTFDSQLAVPSDTSVTLTSGGGDMSVSGLTGDVSATTDGGNMSAANLTGAVKLSTQGGDVTITGLSGTTDIHTGGGNIGGDAITSRDVTATTNGGDVTLTFTRPPANLRVQTSGGNVTILLPPGYSYDVSAHTAGGNTGGNLINDNDFNSGHNVTATTSGGDITVSHS